jgi:hypothetical protein
MGKAQIINHKINKVKIKIKILEILTIFQQAE